jgi:sentrin-specific protease 8
MCLMIKLTPNPLTLKEALPDFTKTTHIFLPINDCNDVEAREGGSHWSLLLMSVIDGVAFHYDSLNGMNEGHAGKVSHNMSILLGKQMTFTNLNETPQQSNQSDCGVFVCLQLEFLLLHRLLKVAAEEKVKMNMSGKNIDADSGRQKILKIISNLRKEGERRRS